MSKMQYLRLMFVNKAMHRKSKTLLRAVFASGDGWRYVVPTVLKSRVLDNV